MYLLILLCTKDSQNIKIVVGRATYAEYSNSDQRNTEILIPDKEQYLPLPLKSLLLMAKQPFNPILYLRFLTVASHCLVSDKRSALIYETALSQLDHELFQNPPLPDNS